VVESSKVSYRFCGVQRCASVPSEGTINDGKWVADVLTVVDASGATDITDTGHGASPDAFELSPTGPRLKGGFGAMHHRPRAGGDVADSILD
jgi:hypothetical protein